MHAMRRDLAPRMIGYSISSRCSQVWQFTLENVRLRMTGAGYSMPDICCDKAKVVCVDCKQFEPKAPS